MKSLLAALALSSVALLAAADQAQAHVTAPIRGSADVIIVMGPFPLEVFDGSDSRGPDTSVSGTVGYLNLGFVEVDMATGNAWPFGFGALFDRAQRDAIDTAAAR
ncbi:MAG: hypothetical protein EP329_21780 [Deltaproteobacteria bacterium]|nr:MAG: hypothetical protein EP329_21780 [Deltaproteobacteria bacterium]